jgi:hypothetical protein
MGAPERGAHGPKRMHMFEHGTRSAVVAFLALASVCTLATASFADTVVITTTSEKTWFGLNEGPSNSVGEVIFAPGPGTPPSGDGSATLQVDDQGRASFGTMLYQGTPLSTISELTYDSYSSSAATIVSPSLQFDVDYDSTDADTTYQGRLVSEHSGVVTPDAWMANNPLGDRWWATRQPGQSVCPQSAPCTWPQVLAAFPNAAIRDDRIQRGALLFRLGGPISGGAITSVDNFTISVGFPSTTYDFEPGATVNPSVAPAGSLIAIQAYGFRPQKYVRVFYYTNATSNSRVKVCRARSTLSGEFYCEVPIPSEPEAGPAGMHTIRIKGPRRIDYLTAFILVP